MKEHSKFDNSEVAEKQKQVVDLCQLVDEAFDAGLIKSREDLDAFLEQKIRIVMAFELENRSENEAKELLEKHKKQIALLALCRLAEEDIKVGRSMSSEELKSRLLSRKLKLQH
ncbi:TPA: hypothetical protein ACMDU7_000545 [Vibrio parahaemolyticus]|nr:hypothetical protein [Vibrio parahaemolyticus]